MKWTQLIPALWLASLGLSWAETDRLYLVVAAEGQSTLQSTQGHGQVKLLKALKAGDKVDVPKGASLTLTSLGNGQRYQLKGPFEYKVSSTAPSGEQVQLLKDVHDREGIRVSHKVDMSKYGGFTSRTVQTGEGMRTVCINFEGSEPVVLDLALTKRRMNGTGVVHYTQASLPYEWATTSGMVKDNKLTLPGLQMKPATTYLVYIEDGTPVDVEAAFAVARLPNDLVSSLKVQQAKSTDQASLLELYESCRNLRLYWRALQLKDRIKSKYPDASNQAEEDFKELWAPVEE
ncbi:hypothetical protein JST97_30415 [bacterium]|nr:hypothetical protein [bacterium]